MIFEASEYRARLARVQAAMAEQDLAALLLTTEADIRYVTGFLTKFWESPTRPWFTVVPATGDPIAVIPAIGAPLMARTWITDIRTWASPDLADDGVSLLSDTLREVAQTGRIATPMEAESHLRMPLSDWQRLTASLPIESDRALLRNLRMVKSPAELAQIRAACAIANRTFARVPEIAAPGTPLDQVFRDFQRLALGEGADWVPYLAGAAGPDGYTDVISPATPAPLAMGDILMLDTGLQKHGYFCDFDRNFAIGPPSNAAKAAHTKLIQATHAAFAIAKPGATMADLFHAMDRVCTGGTGGSDAGRYGHGLGQQLTEWPSIIPSETTPLAPGMVLTLEPSITVKGTAMMVHEENILITDTGAEWLSDPAPPELPVLT